MSHKITAETQARQTSNRTPESVTGPLLIVGSFQLNCQILAPPNTKEYEIRVWEQGQKHGISTTSADVARALWQLTLPFLERRNIHLAEIGPDIVSNSLLFIQQLDRITGGTQLVKAKLGTPTIHVTRPPEPQNARVRGAHGIGTTTAFGGPSIGAKRP